MAKTPPFVLPKSPQKAAREAYEKKLRDERQRAAAAIETAKCKIAATTPEERKACEQKEKFLRTVSRDAPRLKSAVNRYDPTRPMTSVRRGQEKWRTARTDPFLTYLSAEQAEKIADTISLKRVTDEIISRSMAPVESEAARYRRADAQIQERWAYLKKQAEESRREMKQAVAFATAEEKAALRQRIAEVTARIKRMDEEDAAGRWKETQSPEEMRARRESATERLSVIDQRIADMEALARSKRGERWLTAMPKGRKAIYNSLSMERDLLRDEIDPGAKDIWRSRAASESALLTRQREDAATKRATELNIAREMQEAPVRTAQEFRARVWALMTRPRYGHEPYNDVKDAIREADKMIEVPSEEARVQIRNSVADFFVDPPTPETLRARREAALTAAFDQWYKENHREAYDAAKDRVKIVGGRFISDPASLMELQSKDPKTLAKWKQFTNEILGKGETAMSRLKLYGLAGMRKSKPRRRRRR